MTLIRLELLMFRPGIYSAFLLLLTLAAPISAQELTCKAKLADLPQTTELRGFRLGMTPEQVKARVPQVVFGRKNDVGESQTSISPDFDPRIDKSNFADVRTVSLNFLDGRVISLWIGFDASHKWKTTDEFVKGISQELSLPAEWTMKGRAQILKCADFEVSVSPIGGGPSLRIVDLAAEETIVARRQAKADAADAQDAAPEQTPVVGDARKKVYYQPDCKALKAVPEKSRMPFGSQTEAEKAGYKRAGDCQ
jgi:hypothetical protein